MVCKQNQRQLWSTHSIQNSKGVGHVPTSYAVVTASLNKLTKKSTYKIQQPWATSGYVENRCPFTHFDNQINMNLPGNERYLLLNKCFIN